jgi:hypothetical protein
MMNPDIKNEWVTRLRSGEYKQGTGALNRGGSYCCLGVLCEIGVEKGILSKEYAGPGARYMDEYEFTALDNEYDASSELLPEAAREWAGLEDSNPYVSYLDDDDEMYNGLAEVNDNGLTFAEIADLIEDQL